MRLGDPNQKVQRLFHTPSTYPFEKTIPDSLEFSIPTHYYFGTFVVFTFKHDRVCRISFILWDS